MLSNLQQYSCNIMYEQNYIYMYMYISSPYLQQDITAIDTWRLVSFLQWQLCINNGHCKEEMHSQLTLPVHVRYTTDAAVHLHVYFNSMSVIHTWQMHGVQGYHDMDIACVHTCVYFLLNSIYLHVQWRRLIIIHVHALASSFTWNYPIWRNSFESWKISIFTSTDD